MNVIAVLSLVLILQPPTLEARGQRTPASDPGSLLVCARPNPGFLESGDDGPVGLEYDLLSSFADAEHLRLEIVWLESFSDLLPSVEAGECDVGSAGVMVTEVRARRVDFSAPYFPARILYVEPRSELTPDAEALHGKRVAVVHGTLHEEIVSDLPGVEVVTVDEDLSLFEALATGEADGAVCDSAIVLPFLSRFPELAVRFPLSERASFAFALPPGSPLKKSLDEHLAELRRDGSYRLFLVEHFGVEGAAFILDDE